jgi:HTH-type transcriptional regulator/antitoxin HipB
VTKTKTKTKAKLPTRAAKSKAGGVSPKKKVMLRKEQMRNARSFDELLDIKYGKAGAGVKARDRFEKKAKYFIISEVLKEARKEANLTQEQLAEKLGTRKSYISRLENGNCDIQMSTLYKIFEFGLGKKVNLSID